MIICVNCNQKMGLTKMGVIVLEKFEDGSPYKLWSADLFECPTCGHLIVSQFGDKPMAEHYEKDFKKMFRMFKDQIVAEI